MKRTVVLLISLLFATLTLAQAPSARGPSTAKDSWWANAVFYQVFVRSFQDSNGDGIGDLRGLTQRLPDLQTLGVTALWLNPIYPSPSYHGYDVTDYIGVDPAYGTLQDFQAFMAAAKAMRMRVILDFVPNHTSVAHPWFQEAKQPGSAKRDWYLWRDRDPGWKNPLGGAGSPWRATQTSAGGLKVIFAGTIQAALGGKAWDPNGAVTRASEVRPGVYEFVGRLPQGDFEYKVALNGSWDENYGADNKLNGANIKLRVPANGTLVRFVFDRTQKRISDSLNDPSLITPTSPPPTATFDDAPAQIEYYYAPFWEGMPDLNWRNPEVKSAVFGAAKTWLERGVDGFRVDAVRYLYEGESDATPDRPETLAWVKDFSGFVRGVTPDAAVVTEAWADTATVSRYFVGGAGEQMGFNFDLMKAIRDSANAARPAPVNAVLERVAATYPPNAVDAIFTSNHDLERMRFFNSGRYRSAATMLLTLPGTPFIYYGEEIGMPNGSGGRDEDKRSPMRWDGTPLAGFSGVKPWQSFTTDQPEISVQRQRELPGSLYNLYRNLIRIRQGNDALRAGGYTPVSNPNERVFSFERSLEGHHVIVAINLDSDPQRTSLNLNPARGTVRELTLNKTLAGVTDSNAANYPVRLSPYGFVLLEVQR